MLVANGNFRHMDQWSRDGRFIVYTEVDPKTRQDIWALRMEGEQRKPIQFLHSEFNECFGQLSPDSHWMAYTSDKTGRREVYAVSFPSGEDETRISINGGEQPRWRSDGKELFFVGRDEYMMAVAVKTVAAAGPGGKSSFEAGSPQPLFKTHLPGPGGSVLFQYDVTDGKRFLLTSAVGDSGSVPPLTAVVNWEAELKK